MSGSLFFLHSRRYVVGYLAPVRALPVRTRSARSASFETRAALGMNPGPSVPLWSSQHRLLRSGLQRWHWRSRANSEVPRRTNGVRMQADGTETRAVQTEPHRAVTFIRARHILVESEQMANTVLEQIRSCTSADSRTQLFSSLARTLSTCETRTRGGELGWFRRGQMVPSFEEACLEATVHEPFKVRTEFGWHIVEVLELGSQRGVISPEEFAQVYRDPDLRKRYQLVDVREPGELELVSLDGFMNLPLNEYSRWRHLVEGDGEQEPVLDRSRPVIVMCHHGIRSATMCAYLSQQGFHDVLNLLGGIDAYATKVDSSLRRY
ncbi:hypothetical protein CCYA_CCYA06G1816 [Cyanidiococcus yangmingshanensis]|nr:hypothetical protein CCYA_CCYA06G1816 [Cyanidiococcus yangmingshanensis]